MSESEESDILPPDESLLSRKKDLINLFEKFSNRNDEEEVDLINLTTELVESISDDSNEPEEAIEEPIRNEPCQLTLVEYKTLEKDLQAAVIERESHWKEEGTLDLYTRVEDWLRGTQSSQDEDRIDAGRSEMFEATAKHSRYSRCVAAENFKHRTKSMSHRSKPRYDRNKLLSGSDDDDNASVDTAVYIRANQNKRVTRVKKTTIIKEYCVESNNRESRRRIESARSKHHHPAVQYKENLPRDHHENLPVLKGKRRKTRRELNQMHRSFTTSERSDSDDSLFEPRETPKKNRKSSFRQTPRKELKTKPKPLPSIDLKESCPVVPSTPILKRPKERPKPDFTTPVVNTCDSQPAYKKAPYRPSAILQETVNSPQLSSVKTPSLINPQLSSATTPSLKNSRLPVALTPSLNSRFPSVATPGLNSSRYSTRSTVLNDSIRSVKDLPKTFLLYSPAPNAIKPKVTTKPDDKIKITNKFLEEALGQEIAKEILQNKTVEREIDASSQVFIEIPSSDDSDSEADPLDNFNKRVKILIQNSERPASSD